MELWLVFVLYVVGLALVVAEAVLPGMVIGLVGGAMVAVAVVFGFQEDWRIGAVQIVLALVVTPAAFIYGLKRLALKKTLAEGSSFATDWSPYLGREGVAQTELLPGGAALIEGKRMDVVTNGELVEKGRRIRVVKIEGNRIVVRAV